MRILMVLLVLCSISFLGCGSGEGDEGDVSINITGDPALDNGGTVIGDDNSTVDQSTDVDNSENKSD